MKCSCSRGRWDDYRSGVVSCGGCFGLHLLVAGSFLICSQKKVYGDVICGLKKKKKRIKNFLLKYINNL
jgi:hypothetical protein